MAHPPPQPAGPLRRSARGHMSAALTGPSSLAGTRTSSAKTNLRTGMTTSASLRLTGEEVAPRLQMPAIRRRELSLCVPRVELRLYRRTHTSSDVVPRPPHFVYLLRCEWTGDQLPRDPATSSSSSGRPSSPSPRPQSPRPGSPRSPRSQSGAGPEFEEPWPWWDPLPETYVVRRRWHEIVRFHEALSNELAYDSQMGCRRVKARVPTLPERVDLNLWLNGYAAIGDACCLGRKLSSECWAEERERSLEELRDLHWIYVRNRLMPYFAEVTAVLQELPTEILAASTSLRRFVTGGVSGRRQPSTMPVQPRFLGPMPVQAPREDIAATVQLLRRTGSAPNSFGDQRHLASRGSSRGLGARKRGEGAAGKREKSPGRSVSINATSPSAAAAQLVLSKAKR